MVRIIVNAIYHFTASLLRKHAFCKALLNCTGLLEVWRTIVRLLRVTSLCLFMHYSWIFVYVLLKKALYCSRNDAVKELVLRWLLDNSEASQTRTAWLRWLWVWPSHQVLPDPLGFASRLCCVWHLHTRPRYTSPIRRHLRNVFWWP